MAQPDKDRGTGSASDESTGAQDAPHLSDRSGEPSHAEPEPPQDASGSSPARTALRPTTRLPQGSSSESAPADDAENDESHPSEKNERLFQELLASVLSKRNLVTLAAALVICAIIIGVFVFVERGSAPSAEQIQSDVHATLSNPLYGGGDYGSDDPLEMQSIQIREISRTRGGSDPATSVLVQVTLQSSSIQDSVGARLDYEHRDDGWVLLGPPTEVTHAYKALSGVDQDKVLASLDDLLAKAETNLREEDGSNADGDASLPTLYQGATAIVSSEQFDQDQQSDTLVIHLQSKSSFAQRSADVNAHFSFMAASGQWELTEATVSDGAKELDFSPLVGVWDGTFLTQESSGAKCLAAKNHPLSLTVSQAKNGHIEGTLSCIAHFHEAPEEDQDETEGDTDLDELAFSGELASETSPLSSGTPLTFSCTTQDESGGAVSFMLSLGSSADPDEASIRVTSSHTEDKTLLFIPYEQTDTFVDSYQLHKQTS